MTEDDDIEECDGEDCDDPYCEQREEYEVDFTITVKGVLKAHSKDEADELCDTITLELDVQVPSDVDQRWEEGPTYDSTEWWSTSESERYADQARTAAFMAQASGG
jgi:hypothetical protein